MTPDVEFENQPPRSSSLLLLPPHIRRRVYLHAGVARFDGRPYTYYLDGRKENRKARSGKTATAGTTSSMLSWMIGRAPEAEEVRPNFAGLLLSCRHLYTEAAALLYSANRFVIFYAQLGSLKPLRALSPTVLASLTSLKILLNESSCHQPTHSKEYPPLCCCDIERKWANASYCAAKFFEHDVHRRPLLDPSFNLDLTSAKLATQPMLSEWYEAAAYLSAAVGVDRLELSLVCDIDPEHQYSLDVGQLAIAPLTLFPRLKNCHVRLGKKWTRPLLQLAEEAVLQARGSSHPQHHHHQPSPPTLATAALPQGCAAEKHPLGDPLTNLPPELRLRILEYTDLITPWKEVTVSRAYRGYQIGHPTCTQSEGGCPPQIHHGCQLTNCNSGLENRLSRDVHPGCFCRRRHAAFTSTCKCWVPPTALFLVCRALCRDAQFVFFSGNRFVVHDFHALFPWDLPHEQFEPSIPGRYYPYDRLFASDFLRDIIPVHCLGDLRFLELVFPPYEPHGWPGSERATMLDWRDTVDWIRGKVNAPALTLSLVMADFHSESGSEVRKSLTKDQGNQIIKGGYSPILEVLRPLAREDGLSGIYVQVAYPWRWTQARASKLKLHFDHGRGWVAGAEQHLKKHAEEFVRGKDSEGLGPRRTKAEPTKSIWQRWYEVDPGYSWKLWEE